MTESLTILVAGATGRTGSEVVQEASRRGHDIIGIARASDEIEDVRIWPTDHFEDCLTDADVVIDFTVPAASQRFAHDIAAVGCPYVLGTTGFTEAELTSLRTITEEIPLLKATNFAKGVHALLRIIEIGVAALPEYDVELTDTHHNTKRDAPSGTANTILDRIDSVRDDKLTHIYGRSGEHQRESNEIGVHVRRAGTVRGEHELLLAGNDEVITLSHRAESRRVFAAGAVDAAEWILDQEPGWYDFEEVL